MSPLSWRSLKTAVRTSPIHGRGLFAVADIAREEIVAVKGGHIVTPEQLAEIVARLGSVEIQIADELFITPTDEAEREGSMLYSNHSCDPNVGIRGNVMFVAMRTIGAGEELTHDWCMTDHAQYALECNCGSATCRGTITGRDWRQAELQEKYRGYFSAYLAAKISQL